jgi:hypothetical protein
MWKTVGGAVLVAVLARDGEHVTRKYQISIIEVRYGRESKSQTQTATP